MGFIKAIARKHKMKKKVWTSILFMSMVLFAAGCNSGADTTENTGKSVSEAGAVQDEVTLDWKQSTMKVEYGTLRTEYDSTTYQDVDYYFESASLEQEEKERYVKEIAAFFNEVKQGEAFSGGLTVYVGDCITTTCLPGELYINTEGRELPQTFFQMLLSVKDQQSVNAGQVYGLALEAYEAAGIGTVNLVHDNAELAEYFSKEDNLYLLDFALPMFETHYFEEETVQYAKDAAIAFVEYCIQTQSIEKAYELCDTSKADDLVALKNDWLAEIGATAAYEQFTDFTYSYDYEMEEYPYVTNGEMINWHFYEGDVQENGYQPFIKECMTLTEAADLDFEDTQKLLEDYTGGNVAAVNIYTAFTGGFQYEQFSPVYAGIFVNRYNSIYLYQNWYQAKFALLHEYVHYLTMGQGKIFANNNGLVEGWTTAVSGLMCENRLQTMHWAEAVKDEEELQTAKDRGIWDEQKQEVKKKKYFYCLAKYFYDGTDTGEYLSLGDEVITKPEEITLHALSYEAGASLAEYLIEQYGMDAVVSACMEQGEIEELCGKSFEELYNDWGPWNEEKYQEM